MLKLKELRFKNIGRFTEEQVIDFQSLGTLVQVDGQNNNTGGSSGAGKSSVFNSIDYLFGLNDIANTVLQSRLTKETIEVSGTFDWDGQELTISRSKAKGLSLATYGNVISGSSKLAEEKLDEIIAIPRHLFRPMIHKRQKEGGFFLNFTPKETHEFLTDCLGLTSYRDKSEILDLKIKELTNEKAKLTNELGHLNASLQATELSLITLGEPPIEEIDPRFLLVQKDRLDQSIAKAKELSQKHSQALSYYDLVNKIDFKPTPFDRSGLSELKEQLTVHNLRTKAIYSNEHERVRKAQSEAHLLKSELIELKRSKENGNLAKNKILQLTEELQIINGQTCPTCTQIWPLINSAKRAETIHLEIERLNLTVEESLRASSLFDEKVPLLKPLLDEKEFNTPERANILEELETEEVRLKQLVQEAEQKEREHSRLEQSRAIASSESYHRGLSILKDLQGRELEQLRGQIQLEKSIYDTSQAKITAYQSAMVKYSIQHTSFNERISIYKGLASTLILNLNALDKEFQLVSELKRAIKSYISCSFDSALEAISDGATTIIRGIPNMYGATIQLYGITERKDGKIKEEVSAEISMDGELAIPIKSLSGGERSSVDLAVDLAVVDFLETQTGKGCDFMCLDEPFNGLDAASIEMALEVIKNANISKRVLLIDHNPIIKGFLDDRITVARDGATSKIT